MRSNIRAHGGRLIAIGSVLIASACVGGNGDTLSDLTIAITDTPAPFPTSANSVIASPTVNPVLVIPATLLGGNIGAPGFTPGGLPTIAGDVIVTITPTAQPTQPSIVMDIQSGTLTLVGRYYGLASRPAGVALLIAGDGETKENWATLPIRLNEVGYNVLAFDQRGSGETGGTLNWAQTPADASTLLGYLHNLPNIDPRRSITVGSGIGAILALDACAADPMCQNAILISPRLSDHGLTTADAMQRFGSKRALLVISTASSPHAADANALESAATGAHQAIRFAGNTEGVALFTEHPDLAASIANWLTQIALANSKTPH